MSVAEYFKRVYKMSISDSKQPMFLAKLGDKEVHLPTEFCIMDKVPDDLKASREMRDALTEARLNADQKLKTITDYTKNLIKQKALAEWGIEITSKPYTMDTKVLPPPMLQLANGDTKICNT